MRKVVSQEMLAVLGREKPTPPRREHRGQVLDLAGRREFDLARWIEEHEVPIKREGEWNQDGYKYILEECPWNGHTDSSAYIVQFGNGAVAAGCHHNSCQGNGWRELREHYEPGCYDRLQRGVRANEDDDVGSEDVVTKLPPAPPFPLAALPPTLRTFVLEAADAIGCPPEFIAVPMLATLGAAIGNSRVVWVKRGWTEGATLYAAVVSDPGSKKTPASKVATRPAWRRQSEYKREYDDAMDAYHREKREWEAQKRQAAREGEPAPEQPEEPIMRRTVIEDTTVEALGSRLEENPRGLLCAKDELSGWVRSLDQYKGGKGSDRQFWLSAWSNSPGVVDRKSRKDPLMIPRPFVGLAGPIQPDILPELKNYREDGLLDRFLFAYPDPMPSRWSDDEISDEATAGYQELYDQLSSLEMALDENGEPAPEYLSLSPEFRPKHPGLHSPRSKENAGNLSWIRPSRRVRTNRKEDRQHMRSSVSWSPRKRKPATAPFAPSATISPPTRC